jgi:DNA polymerase-1
MSKTALKNKKRLVLLDSHAIIHRAYHALPEFTGPDGEPTGALYGLVTMLLKIIADLKPDYIAACYDLPKPTHRHEVYEAYKGKRAEIDANLIKQLESSRKIFEAFSIPIYDKEGFEADDLLGTIAHLLKKDKETEVVIASGDMDTLQLVDGKKVQVYTLKKGLNDTILYDEKAVEERFGFSPRLIPDYKGLRGDPSDNIIGIPGVGEKTATELVTNFGTVENMYKVLKKSGEKAFLDKGVKARTIELLKEHQEDAVFSKMLATIRVDAPCNFNLDDTRWPGEAKLETILALFETFGFRTLRERVRALFVKMNESGAVMEEIPEELMEKKEEETVDRTRFEEAQIMLWLLASDFGNATIDDMCAHTKTHTFDEAYLVLEKEIKETGRLSEVYENIEKPLIAVLRKMETRGVLIDAAVFATLTKKYHAELAGTEARIYKLVGHEFNINSPKQLGTVLFDELGLKPKGQKKTAGGQRSTRESELEKIKDEHAVIAEILEYREVGKLLSTYIDSIPLLLDSEHRLHTKYLQTGTTTGRMASADPNLQNIPIRSERGRAIRDAFVASPGYTLLALDYSQIELRIAAFLSGDEKLCDIFRSGRDVHTEVAARVFAVAPNLVDREMRRRAKIINFGILYGMGVNALRTQLGTSSAEAHQFYDDYFEQFTGLAEYLENTKGFARKHGYTETYFGRRRQFAGMKSSLPFVRAQAERMAINAPIQGTQADVIKLAMVRINELFEKEKIRDDAHLLLQVHDELVFEIKNGKLTELAGKIKEIMESVLTPDETNGIPLRAEGKAGNNWGEMKPLSQ